MFLSNLPNELNRLIFSYLNAKSSITLRLISKDTKKLIDTYTDIWKDRCVLDYSFNFDKAVIKDYFKKYISLHSTLCVGCNKKTSSVEFFSGDRVCWNCQRRNEKYRKICQTSAIKEYNVDHDDLSKLRVEFRQNPHYRKYPMKLFLLSEVISISKKKYDELALVKLNEDKKRKRLNKLLKKQLKYFVLQETLYRVYNLDISKYILNINEYSLGLYTKYINNIGKINKDLASQIVERFLELEYLTKVPPYQELGDLEFLNSHNFNVGIDDDQASAEIIGNSNLNNHINLTAPIEISYNYIHIPNYKYFTSYLTHQLLTDTYQDTNCNYIKTKVLQVMTKYPDKFLRKKAICDRLNGIVKFSLIDLKIIDYIDSGIGNIDDIVTEYLEDDFISKHYGIMQIMWESMTEKISIKQLYTQIINEKYKEGVHLPDVLYEKYILKS